MSSPVSSPMSGSGPKQAIYAELAGVAQALGHGHRLELLEHLAQAPRSVEELSARARLSFANTSRHLQILRRARLVDAERRGKQVIYRLAGEAEVVTLLRSLASVGERNITHGFPITVTLPPDQRGTVFGRSLLEFAANRRR